VIIEGVDEYMKSACAQLLLLKNGYNYSLCVVRTEGMLVSG